MISYVGVFLNVFNLMPIRPLDGGRVTQAVGSWFKYVGVGALAVFSTMFHEPVILFIWILVMPEITAIPLRLRAAIAALMWIAMVTLMALGYSSQPFWVDIIDCIAASILTIGLAAQAYGNNDFADEDDNRPQLQMSEKFKWFIRYAVLTVVLAGLMVFQIQNLPVIK